MHLHCPNWILRLPRMFFHSPTCTKYSKQYHPGPVITFGEAFCEGDACPYGWEWQSLR
eukprot:UN28310